jgi:Rieske Fe-S protein
MARWWAGVAAAGPLGGCAVGLFGGGAKGEVRVATLDQVPAGAVLRSVVEDQPVLVVNVGGRIRVLSGLCTHEACELGWNAGQRLIRCPCHGSAFDVDGRVRLGPAEAPLPELPSRVGGGGVYVVTRPVGP